MFAEELVHAGWEKCWSRRENRPYYFNRFTNQSLWEMPVLGQHDVIVSASLGHLVFPKCTLDGYSVPSPVGTVTARQTQPLPSWNLDSRLVWKLMIKIVHNTERVLHVGHCTWDAV